MLGIRLRRETVVAVALIGHAAHPTPRRALSSCAAQTALRARGVCCVGPICGPWQRCSYTQSLLTRSVPMVSVWWCGAVGASHERRRCLFHPRTPTRRGSKSDTKSRKSKV